MILDEVREHYERLWGQPSKTGLFRYQGLQVEVHKWNQDTNREEVFLYATIGASLYTLAESDPNHRIEVFTGMLPEQDVVVKPLSMLGMEPGLHGTSLSRGHTVTYPEPLWRGTQMCSFLVLGPVPDVIPFLEVADGTHVEFLQAVPIFPSELAFKSKHGVEALMQRWEAAEVPFWNPERLPEPAQ